MKRKLFAYRCRRCGHATHPHHTCCPKCRNTEFEEFELKRGRLVSYTVVQAVSPGVRKPLHLGIAEFEGGVRVLGQLSFSDAKLGTRIRPVYAQLRRKGGKIHTGFRFAKYNP